MQKISILYWVAFLISGLLGKPCWSTELSKLEIESFFQSLNSRNLKIYTAEQTRAYATSPPYPILLEISPEKFLETENQESILDSLDPFHTECLHPNHQTLSSAPKISKFWEQCEPSLRRPERFTQNAESIKVLGTQFDFLHHPLARMVEWKLPKAIRVRGVLLLSGLHQNKPLIIFRPGIYSNLSSMMAERYLAMQLYDLGEAHLLILPSITGKDFIQDNTKFSFGGLEEAMHSYLIGQMIVSDDEPLHRYVKDLRLVSISLGGWGAWLATQFDQKLHSPSLRIFKKTLLMCPLINFEATENSFNDSIIMKILAKKWKKARLQALLDRNHQLLPANLRVSDSDTQLQWLDQHFREEYREPLVGWPADIFSFLSKKHLEPHDFVNLNRWRTYFDKPPTNTLVFYSDTDPLVPPELNIGKFKSLPDEGLTILRAKHSYHCSLGFSYHWNTTARLVRSFLELDLENPKSLNEIATIVGESAESSKIYQESMIRRKNYLNFK